ncbi:MAG: hypothetical protein HKO56_06895, partial [Bacteroidia bacterium]|nr:hypothetical protein [Bacteroidia bacterium]
VLVWTITSLYGGCLPTTDTVVINVDSAITVANAGADIYLCNLTSTTLSANAPAATETGTWSVLNGTGVVLSINDPVSGINSLTISDSTVLVWTITSQFGGCPSTSDTVVVYSDAPVTAAELGADYRRCNVDSVLVLGNGFAANETVTWNIINGTGTIASPNSQSTWMHGLTLGDTTTVTYTIGSLFGGCPTDTDTLDIFIDFATTIANAGPDQAICNDTSATLSGNAHAPYESGEWVIQSGAATLSATTDSIVTLLNLDPGDSIVVTWTISSAYGGCPQTVDTVIVTVDPTLTIANAGADQNLCDTTAATLTANSPLPSETGTWSVLNGTAIVVSPNDSNSVVANLTVGDSSVLVWTITSQFGGCTSSSDTVTISSDFVTTIANAGTDQSLCTATNTIITANTPAAYETGTWNIINGGTAIVATPASPISAVIGFAAGDTIDITWTINSEFGGCAASVDTMRVISYENSTVAKAGLDTTQCKAFTTYNLKANTPTAGVGVWTVTAGAGTFGNANDPNTTVSGLAFGTNTFQWTITNGVCASDSDEVSVMLINCNPQFVDGALNPLDTLYVTTNEDSAIVVCVGMIDVDGDSVDITAGSSLSGNGSVNVNPLGDTCFVFTPNLNYNGMDTLQIFGCDSAGICDSLIVIVTIDSVNNDTPQIVDSLGNDLDTLYLTVNEDSSVSHCFTLLDADGDNVTISTSTAPGNGVFTIDNDSCFTYIPDTNYYGNDIGTIIACDTTGLCDTVIVMITIIPDTTSDPPVIVDSLGNHLDTLYLTVNEDSMITHCLTIIEPDSQTVTLTNIIT